MMKVTNEVRLGSNLNLTRKREGANLSFKEIGHGFFTCDKDRNGGFHNGLYTAEEVKEQFDSNNKVLIQVRDGINKFGEYILSPITNFD